MNKIYTPILLGILLGLGACSKKDQEESVKEKKWKQLSTILIEPKLITQKVSITGLVRPKKKLDVIAQVQGIALATSPHFKEGIHFQKGEVLVAVDDSEFRSNLIAQKSQFVSSLVRVMSDLKIDYPVSFPAWEQYLDRVDIEKSLPDLPEVDNKQLRYFFSANEILNSYYSIKSQEKQLSEFRIYAPYDGVVTEDNFNVGSLIRSGISLGEFIYTDSYEIIATISLGDLTNIKKSEKVQFTSKDTNEKWDTTLIRISDKVDASTQSVNVFFEVSGKDLKEGMYLEADLEVRSYENAIELPKDILTRNEQVYILKDSIIQLKTVKPLAYLPSSVIVTGLSPDDQVINEQIKPTLQGTKAISNR
ncbi:MAG: HlyD family efflux transporter periplasmic adaptor subunit [Bacteroidota bacterium]